MLENFYGRNYRYFLKLRKEKINKSLTNDEAFCYLGRYPDIAKKVGRYNLYGGKEHWYTKGKYKNLDKSCPYLIPKDEFEERLTKHDAKNKEKEDIISDRKLAEKAYRDKKARMIDMENSIDDLNYKIYDKQYSVPEFDISKLFSENEGFSNYIIEGAIGINEYANGLKEVSNQANQAITAQNTTISDIEKSLSFLEQVSKDTENTNLTLQNIQKTSSDKKENKIREVEKQNEDIDKIIIENTKNNAAMNYTKGFYLQHDTTSLKDFNQYYLFWIYFILVIATSFIFMSKINQDNKIKTFIFISILAIYPFVIGMIQTFGYNLLYKIYDYFNFNIYNKT